MPNWWVDNQGRNNLRGLPDDPSNPAILPDGVILEFLKKYAAARADFKNIVPTMTPEEQERLNGLVARNPSVMYSDPDPQVVEDRVQKKFNTSGIRTVGRFGGNGSGIIKR